MSAATEALIVALRATSSSTHHPSEIPSPPLLLPSTTHRDDLPEADMPLRKRARFTAPTSRFEVGESSSATAASRGMATVGEANERVTDLATTQRQDAQELYVRCEDAQDDRSLLRTHVFVLTREKRYFRSMASFYKREAVITRHAWSHSKSRVQAMEALIRALQRDVDVLQRQRIRDEDKLRSQIQHEHNGFRELVRTTEAGPQDGPVDAGSSC
ncbi:hypothetical protein Tco_0540216 [Tanacetum coccineum]